MVWLKITKLDKVCPETRGYDGASNIIDIIHAVFGVRTEFWMLGEPHVSIYKGCDSEDYYMVRVIYGE